MFKIKTYLHTTWIGIIIIISIIVLSLYYCRYNYRFWEHVKTDNFESLMEYRGNRMKGLAGRQILIHKDFEPYISRIDEYARKRDVRLIITSSYRAGDRKLYNTVVRPANMSNHNAGYAIDFNVLHKRKKYLGSQLRRNRLNCLPKNIQDFINDIRQDEDLRWGGDFNQEDPVHVDYPINLRNRRVWEEYSKLCYIDYSERVPKWRISRLMQ